MILCCWSSNARLSQRILKLQMPTAKVGYRAPKRKAQHRTQPPFFSSDLFLYMSWTGLAKLRKRRLHSSPRSVCIGGLGVVLCTAFLFEVQTTPRYASCFFLNVQSQLDTKQSKSYWKVDETALCGVSACQEPKISVMGSNDVVWSCLDEALYEKARLRRSRLVSESINSLIRCHGVVWLFIHCFHSHSMCVTGSRRATSSMPHSYTVPVFLHSSIIFWCVFHAIFEKKLGSHIKLWCLRHSFKAMRYTLWKASLGTYSYCY